VLIHVDEDQCVGAGQCVLAAPEVFDQRDDDGIVVVLHASPPADVHKQVVDAVERCPAGALRLTASTQ